MISTNAPVIDPATWLKLPNRELGFLLLAQFAEAQAAELGIPLEEVSLEFMEQVRQHVLTLAAGSADEAPLQIALHAVASGDPERAGRFFREHLLNGAQRLRDRRFVRSERERLKNARRKGGKASGAKKRQQSREPEILAMADKFKRSGRPRNEWASIIADRLRMSDRRVRAVLKEKRK